MFCKRLPSVKKIVYIEIYHARTLSRDLSILFDLGYQAEESILFDYVSRKLPL